MKAPKIRFKGFEGAWEEKKLGELCIWISEKYWERSDLEVFSVNNKNGFILQTEHFDNNEIASKDKRNYKIVTKNQFAYNPSRINVWSIAYLKKQNAVIVSPLYNIFECKKELNEMFLERFMKTFLFNKQRILNTEVSVRECLSFEGYCKIKIIKPETKEQEKIWSLFEQLDSQISKNQQKLEKLKNMKQSFLQKLFSKDWSAFPELRFKGFEEAWEERKLGENVEEINRKDEKSTANIMMISANEWFINQSIRYSYDNFWKSLTKYIILRKGELGYNHWASKIRPYGSCFVLKQDEARVPFVYHCFKVKNNNPYFFELTLNSKQVEKKLKKIISSWARMDGLLNISYSAYVDINIVIPSLPEQEKIWAFFEKFDTQITQQSQKLEKLKNIKQSLLEKMFI